MNHSRNLEALDQFEPYDPSAAELLKYSGRRLEQAETLTPQQRVVSLVCALVAAGIMTETLFFKF